MSAATPANNNAGARTNGRSSARRDGVRDRLVNLKRLRDEIRVELNLGGKEARDRWHRIEARIRAVQATIRRGEGPRALAPIIASVKRFRAALRLGSKSA